MVFRFSVVTRRNSTLTYFCLLGIMAGIQIYFPCLFCGPEVEFEQRRNHSVAKGSISIKAGRGSLAELAEMDFRIVPIDQKLSYSRMSSVSIITKRIEVLSWPQWMNSIGPSGWTALDFTGWENTHFAFQNKTQAWQAAHCGGSSQVPHPEEHHYLWGISDVPFVLSSRAWLELAIGCHADMELVVWLHFTGGMLACSWPLLEPFLHVQFGSISLQSLMLLFQ